MTQTKISNIELLEKANVLVGYLDDHSELTNVHISDIRQQLQHMLYLLERRKEKRGHK